MRTPPHQNSMYPGFTIDTRGNKMASAIEAICPTVYRLIGWYGDAPILWHRTYRVNDRGYMV